MFELFRLLGPGRWAREQAPCVLVAGVVAEAFYKFHSFTLECGAFLLTWAAVDAVRSVLVRSPAEEIPPRR